MVWTILIIGLIAALALVLILASRKPDVFQVERRALIYAAPEEIFPYINTIQKGQLWSPWVELEPDANYTAHGPEEGVDAGLSWIGKKTGEGRLTIIESVPNKLVKQKLEFFKPMKAVNTCDYILEPESGATKMTWVMYGPNNFMSKIMNVFINCEKICGDQFEKGLANLKILIEKPHT